MIIEIIVLGAAGLFAWSDSRTGWKRSKKIGNFLKGKFDQVAQGSLTPGQKVERLLDAYRIRVEKFRDGVSLLQANADQSLRISQEEEANAKDARRLAKKAMNKGLEKEAEEAIIMAVNAEERAKIYYTNAVQYRELSTNMLEDLVNVEGEYEIIKTKADTIRVHDKIAETNRNLYEVLSEVSKDGATPLGKLIELAEQTEKDALASTIKIRLAQNSPEAQRRNFRRLIQGSQIEEELENLKSSRMLTQGENKKTEEGTEEAS